MALFACPTLDVLAQEADKILKTPQEVARLLNQTLLKRENKRTEPLLSRAVQSVQATWEERRLEASSGYGPPFELKDVLFPVL
jgi:hypothetical protein